jgi:hypothetical protein
MVMTEQQPFDLVRRYPGFDLRRYPAHTVAEVTVRASFDRAGNSAFRSLFGYISGQNRTNASVAMTAPVVQAVAPTTAGQDTTDQNGGSHKVAMTAPVVQRPAGDGEFVVAFVLPASLTADTAPVPTNPQVEIHTIPAGLAAAVGYSGGWSQSGFDKHSAQLQQAVRDAGLTPIGPPRFARFDPPFKPWFLRRNEVVQDVREPA